MDRRWRGSSSGSESGPITGTTDGPGPGPGGTTLPGHGVSDGLGRIGWIMDASDGRLG